MAGNKKKTTSKKKESSKKKDEGPKKSIVSFKDVAMHFMMGGTSAVEQLNQKLLKNPANEGEGLSAKVLWAALDSMDGSSIDTAALQEYTVKMHGEKTEGRGRTTPAVGESRTYKAQQLEKGDPFLRLPLGPLDVEKGANLKVSFNEGSILVTIASGEEAEAGE